MYYATVNLDAFECFEQGSNLAGEGRRHTSGRNPESEDLALDHAMASNAFTREDREGLKSPVQKIENRFFTLPPGRNPGGYSQRTSA